MGVIVVLRHAAKQYGNRSKLFERYDSPIVEDEWSRSKIVFSKHISDHNLKPTRIISSPYRRTRETASILSEMTGVEVEINREVSNYLGWHKNCNENDFYPETYEFEPYPPEDIEDFRKRVTNIFENISKDLKDDDVIWIITHRFLISTHLTEQNIKSKRFKPLEGIVIKEENCTLL